MSNNNETIMSVNNFNQTLEGSIQRRNLPAVRNFFERQGVKITPRHLELAIQRGYMPTIRYLVEQGVDLNEPFPGGRTALGLAIAINSSKLVDYLLKQGANQNVKSFFESRLVKPIDIARELNRQRIIDLLVSYKGGGKTRKQRKIKKTRKSHKQTRKH